MKILKEKILKDGYVREGNILKVSSFLNHQMDINLIQEIGKEFKERFKNEKIDKILTIESSGIGIAVIVAQYFGNVPVVFAKKTESLNIDSDVYSTEIKSYTKNKVFDVRVEKVLLKENENILIIDDFLAKGEALNGLLEIANKAKANVVGCGIVIEKGFQDGGKKIRDKGIKLESLAIIDRFEDNKVILK